MDLKGKTIAQGSDGDARSAGFNDFADYQNKMAQRGAGSGGGTQAYDSLLTSMPKAQDFAQGLNTGENQAFGDYFKYMSNQQSPLDFYTKMSEAQGIPGLRKTQSTLQGQIYDMEDSLRRIEPDVSANSRNSIVTESQRRGIVGEKQKPLIENLGWLGQSLGRVSNAVTEGNQQALTMTGLNSENTDRIGGVFKTNLELKSSQAARQMTGFTTDMQNFLNVSLAKIQRGEQVSDQEAQQAFDLLKMEKQYNLEYDSQKKLAELGGSDKDRYISVGDKSSLFDTKTQTFVNAGSTGSGNTTYKAPTPTSPKPTSKPTSGSSLGGATSNPSLYKYLFGGN